MPPSTIAVSMPPKNKKEEGRRGSSSKGTASATFVAQMDKYTSRKKIGR